MSSLIPDTSNAESSDKKDNDVTKKRRSFIPVESKLEENTAFETEAKESEDNAEPEKVQREETGEVHKVASGDSEDSETEEDSEEPAESGSGNSGIVLMANSF